jgi:hypothetical protein
MSRLLALQFAEFKRRAKSPTSIHWRRMRLARWRLMYTCPDPTETKKLLCGIESKRALCLHSALHSTLAANRLRNNCDLPEVSYGPNGDRFRDLPSNRHRCRVFSETD